MRKDTLILIGIALTAIAVGIAIFVSGRGSLPEASRNVAENQPAVVSVSFTEIAHGAKSTVTTRVNYVITSMDELNKLWKMIDATGKPPTIDFTTQSVIAVFAGKEPGSTIAVAKIEDAQTRTVSIAIAKPDSACTKKQSTVSPYEIVAVPSTSLPLAHEDLSTTVSCPN